MRIGIACGPPKRTAAAVDLAARAGAPAESLRGAVRPALVERDGHTVVLARPGDLLTLCGRDALDVAILGAEVLLERGPVVVELLDLDLGGARLIAAASSAGAAPAAGSAGAGLPRRPVVATAHPRLTRRYLEARGCQPRVVEFVDEPWLAARLARVDLVVGLVDEGDEPDAPFVARGEVAAAGLCLVAGLAAHALRGDELARFAGRAKEAVRP